MEISQEILKKLARRTLSYFTNDLNIPINQNNFNVIKVKQLDCLDISTMIALNGAITGTVVMSVSNYLANKMIEKSIFGEIEETLLEELASENVAETLNIVLGNIITELNIVRNGEVVDISTPYTLHNRVSITKKKDGKMFKCILKHKTEKIVLSYFI